VIATLAVAMNSPPVGYMIIPGSGVKPPEPTVPVGPFDASGGCFGTWA
jgi:hypothetical protein